MILISPGKYGERGLAEIAAFSAQFSPLDTLVQIFAFSLSHQAIRSSKERTNHAYGHILVTLNQKVKS